MRLLKIFEVDNKYFESLVQGEIASLYFYMENNNMGTDFSKQDIKVLYVAINDYLHNSPNSKDKHDIRIAGDLEKLLNNTNIIFSYNSKQPLKKLHITEQKYPEQTKRFREILDEMYQVHLDKNSDYSPMNILATGTVGVATRIWDKTARILSLLGWDLQTGQYSIERISPKDESIEDNLKDLSVYCIIARLLREGKWGK